MRRRFWAAHAASSILALTLALFGQPSKAAAATADTASALPDTSATMVVMLGTGTPNADPDRSGPSVAIVAGGRAYLVDCGPGVVRRAAAAQRAGVTALMPESLSIVFITHLHSDHTVGLPDLMLTPWVLERRRPLAVYGPPGVRAMTDHLLAAYAEDIRVRNEGLEPDKTDGWQVQAHGSSRAW
jgi:ribonuclease BN (tRNA processing enzyme)